MRTLIYPTAAVTLAIACCGCPKMQTTPSTLPDSLNYPEMETGDGNTDRTQPAIKQEATQTMSELQATSTLITTHTVAFHFESAHEISRKLLEQHNLSVRPQK